MDDRHSADPSDVRRTQSTASRLDDRQSTGVHLAAASSGHRSPTRGRQPSVRRPAGEVTTQTPTGESTTRSRRSTAEVMAVIEEETSPSRRRVSESTDVLTGGVPTAMRRRADDNVMVEDVMAAPGRLSGRGAAHEEKTSRRVTPTIKLGSYDGSTKHGAEYYGWNEHDRLCHLKASLECHAGQVLWEIDAAAT